MALFVTLAEGRTGATARAILASDDPDVIRAVIAALERRLRGETRAGAPLTATEAETSR